MMINHRLIALGLAFGLLGSTCAFARPMPEKESVTSHFPTAKTSDATGYARRPSANTVKSDWPANMILDSYETPAFRQLSSDQTIA
jgi:hypothetical protein